MVRLLSSLLLLVGCAWTQIGTPSTSMTGKTDAVETASPNAMTPTAATASGANNSTAFPNVLLQPRGKTTLVGGKIGKIDHLRDRLILEVYGGSRTAVLFDERTRVLRGDKLESVDDLKSGERVYVDTTLDGTAIFARTIRVAEVPTGKSSGQIVAFDASSGKLTVRDPLSPEEAELHIVANTVIQRGDQTATRADLRPGTLVSLSFVPGRGGAPEVSRILILASPGSAFVFVGRIIHLDLHRGLMVLVDPRDDQTYEVSIDRSGRRLTQDLRQGMDVTVRATFNGSHYQATDITINSARNK